MLLSSATAGVDSQGDTAVLKVMLLNVLLIEVLLLRSCSFLHVRSKSNGVYTTKLSPLETDNHMMWPGDPFTNMV